MSFADSLALLERPRFMAALSARAQLVVLVGPIGAGATTLLRQWAARNDGVVTWGRAGALRTAASEVLIIDNADELNGTDWEKIRELRRASPALALRLAVHSHRAIPAEEEAEFVFALSFTMPETTQFLAGLSSDLDPGVVQRATGGLPAAVRTIAELNTNRPPLVNEVLARLRPGSLPSEHSMLAVPESLTEDVVLGLGGPSDFLDEAERRGLGEWVAETGHPVFRLTASVRAATLLAHPLEAAQPLRVQVGKALLTQHAWFSALVEGIASGSLDTVDAALKGGGMSMVRRHGPMLEVLLRDIPLRELQRRPVIAMTLAIIFNARQQHRLRAVEMMGVALLGVGSTPAGSAERAVLLVIESVARRLLGTGDGGVKAAKSATIILAELPAEGQQEISGLLGDLHSHAAISLMYGGCESAAIAEFERALAEPGRPTVELVSYGGIAMIHALAGDLTTAQRWVCTALERPWAASVLDRYPGSLLRIAQAKIFLEGGELDDADEALEHVWHTIGTVEHWPALAHLRAMIDIARGRSSEGLERLRALRHQRGAKSPRSQVRLLDLTESSLMLMGNEAGSTHSLRARTGDQPAVVVGVARATLFAGRPEQALRVLTEISADGPEVRAHREVLKAIALSRLDRRDEAEFAARRARTIADAHGLSTPFLLIPEADRELFNAEMLAPPAVSTKSLPQLTEREEIVLTELLHTANANEIAQRLHVSVNTVKSQRTSLYRKLGATSREEVLAIALGHGLLIAPDSSPIPRSGLLQE